MKLLYDGTSVKIYTESIVPVCGYTYIKIYRETKFLDKNFLHFITDGYIHNDGKICLRYFYKLSNSAKEELTLIEDFLNCRYLGKS